MPLLLPLERSGRWGEESLDTVQILELMPETKAPSADVQGEPRVPRAVVDAQWTQGLNHPG